MVLLRGSASEVAETEMEPVASVRVLTVNARTVFKRLVQNAEAPTQHSSPKPPKEEFLLTSFEIYFTVGMLKLYSTVIKTGLPPVVP